MDGTDEVVQQAVSAASVGIWTMAGAALGALTALILILVLRIGFQKSPLMSRFSRRTRGPFYWLLIFFGAWFAFGMAAPIDANHWYDDIQHVLLILLIAALGWYLYATVNLLEDAARARSLKDPSNARRFQTQAQVLRRVIQTVVVLVTIIMVLLTFPAVRTPMASLLASAGVVSVVAGLAAQSTLGNMFAGMQLAFTDAIRVGDTVTVANGAKVETGTVEEVTLTYVVVHIWDGRRILLPSSDFTTKPFENWTRRTPDQLGRVEIDLDWTAPVARIRQQVQKILLESDMWDGRTWAVMLTNSVGPAMTLRIVLSSRSPGDRQDLECHVREAVIAWINQEIPYALPRTRIVPEEVTTLNRDLAKEEVAKLAAELSDIAGDEVSGDRGEGLVSAEPAPGEANPVHAARMLASRRRAKRERRRLSAKRQALATYGVDEEERKDETELISAVERESIAKRYRKLDDTGGSGDRLFSGSPEAEKRARLFDGPGEEVVHRREQTALMQALDAQGKAINLPDETMIDIPEFDKKKRKRHEEN